MLGSLIYNSVSYFMSWMISYIENVKLQSN